MLRIYLMQNWWFLRDNAMEDALIDTGAICCFAGIDLAQDNIPDATTILAFRHFVEQHQLGEQIFKTVDSTWKRRACCCGRGQW